MTTFGLIQTNHVSEKKHKLDIGTTLTTIPLTYSISDSLNMRQTRASINHGRRLPKDTYERLRSPRASPRTSYHDLDNMQDRNDIGYQEYRHRLGSKRTVDVNIRLKLENAIPALSLFIAIAMIIISIILGSTFY